MLKHVYKEVEMVYALKCHWSSATKHATCISTTEMVQELPEPKPPDYNNSVKEKDTLLNKYGIP